MHELNVKEIQEANGGFYFLAGLIAEGAIAMGPSLQRGLDSLNDTLDSVYGSFKPSLPEMGDK